MGVPVWPNMLNMPKSASGQSHDPQLTRTDNVVKFRRVVFEVCEETDRERYRRADPNTSHSYRLAEAKSGVNLAAVSKQAD